MLEFYIIDFERIQFFFKKLIAPAFLTIIITILLLLLRKFFFQILKNFFTKKELKTAEAIIKSIKIPSLILCIALSFYISVLISEVPEKFLFYVNKAIIVITIFTVTIAISTFVTKIIQFYTLKTNLSIPSTGLISTVLNIFIMITGILLILTTLGISITPIITALGIGGLAVALALKDTLSNIFSGIHILVEKSIRVGDYIRLESGLEGSVEDLTWRTARIKTINNNMVIIPNEKLSQSIVINYSLPDTKMSIQLPVSVSYSSDLNKVEEILLDIVKEATKEIEGLLDEPPPLVRFTPGFSESSLDLTLICFIKEFRFQNPIQHELRKRILHRFRKDGIQIPYPHRVVFLKNKED